MTYSNLTKQHYETAQTAPATSYASLNSPTGKAAVKEHAKIVGKEAGAAAAVTKALN